MQLFSYVVRHDIGFAPNPFHGWCTLATCKPGIRGAASVGDWIVGTGSKSKGLDGRLVFAMKVEEKVTFHEYWNDARSQRKKPDPRGSMKYRYGDNIYHRTAKGRWKQADSRHSLSSGAANKDHIARDTSRDAVLLSKDFTYWGGEGPTIPRRFRDWKGVDLCLSGPGFKTKAIPERMRQGVVGWINTLERGYQGKPADW